MKQKCKEELCNLCGSSSFVPFYTKGRFNKKMISIICSNCGLVTNCSSKTKESSLDNFKEDAKYKFDADSFNRYLKIAKARVEFVKPFLKKQSSGLEMGGGLALL